MTQSSTVSPRFEKGHIKVGLDRDDKKPVKLYYEITGKGPIKLLLITGLGTPASGWDPVVEYFSKRLEYTIVAFDNRGAGYSDAPHGLYSTSQMAQDALDLLDALGWYSNVNVAGISMGGMISLELVHAAPKRFSSLVLTSTNAGRSPPQLVTMAFFARVLTILDPHLRLRFITEHLYPKLAGSTCPARCAVQNEQRLRRRVEELIRHGGGGSGGRDGEQQLEA
ncbi:hypothetical protein BGZ95_004066 [Linnemannia exigua]|uniref:AB hydrolase-1 domain-containing protein n=1 Tax=Linnemannia exigua TaxID=604196 RepID=A0AAD4DJU8_9FUNG|nr:hypothetical protein BGZ95_004066 [Linnemannia exigua]